jgi:pimeloyl-ACP methyl ester carboxylesterase
MTFMYRQPGLAFTDHVIQVPLDHAQPGGERIEVFAREVVGARKLDRHGQAPDDLPWLVYLQGGPGGKADRPAGGRPGWLNRALDDYRVVLLDQRGTGRSTPATRQTLTRLGPPSAQAEYLEHFRADSIVRDAELVRHSLAGAETRWTALGQSFGGFCTMTYLSLAPEGLQDALVTGGLPPLAATVDEIYRATYQRTLQKNEAYYARYPEDAALAARVAAHLRDNDVRLPTGERFTPRRFQHLGIRFGQRQHFDDLHFLLEEAFIPGSVAPALSDTFLHGVGQLVSFAPMPLYAVLHEACWAQGRATNWSAERVRAEYPQFDPDATPLLFTGEMIYPWMFEEDPALVPLRETAEILATKVDWPPLYDVERLHANEVPLAAAIYHDDMYVEYAFSLETAKQVGACRYWVTNEHEHDGLRSGRVLDHLIGLARGLW